MSEFASGQLFVRGDENINTSAAAAPVSAAAGFASSTASMMTSDALSAAIRSPSLSSLKNLRDTLMRSDSQSSGLFGVDETGVAVSNSDGDNSSPEKRKQQQRIARSGKYAICFF